MATVNFGRREILCKVVYYGPGLCGKTTNLQAIHAKVPDKMRGNLTSVATQQDRTLFFDLLPIEIGKIRDFSVRMQLYTVPGQVYYNASRRIVLKGVDGIVFVADSQHGKMEENIESLENLRENLEANNINPANVPIVLQYNKRDLSPVYSVEELNQALNPNNLAHFESVATTGQGVFNTLKGVTALVVQDIKQKLEAADTGATKPKPKPAAAQPKPSADPAQQPAEAPKPQEKPAPAPMQHDDTPMTETQELAEPDSEAARSGFWKKVSTLFGSKGK
ncbi:gliding-motility protein MglA [bacterium]|nr:gliding-motility protein MglA [bacterium]